jgi:small-conductance mechanosensitive channel
MNDTLYMGNTIEAWATGIGIAIAVTLVLRVLVAFVIRRLGKFAEKTKTPFDDLVVEVLKRTRIFFFVIVGLYLGCQAIVLPAKALRLCDGLLILGVLVQAGLWGNAIITFVLSRAVKREMEKDGASATTLTSLGMVVRIVLWSVVLLLALDNLGVNITGLVAGLGIGGVAVALALQNILGDLFASLSIALDKPFVIGDFIIVDQLMGTVEHVGLKTTRIRSLSGEQLVFSNGDLLKSRVRNFKRMYERRVVFSIGVTYQTPYEKLAAIPATLKSIVQAQPEVRFDRAHFKEYADSSLNFEIVYYVLDPDYNKYMDIQQSINLEIYKQFQAEGIEFAYPTRTLFLQNSSDGTRTPDAIAKGSQGGNNPRHDTR